MVFQDAEVRQWAMIAFGLAVGGLARWALLLRDKEPVTWKVILPDLMVMGILGLAAKWTVDRLGIRNETTALIAALFALASESIVRLMLAWFLTSARRAARDAGDDRDAPADRARARRIRAAAPVAEHDEELDQPVDEQDLPAG